MKVLGIYGAGGLGREVCELANIINSKSPRWDNIIFISDFKETEEVNGVKVFSFEEAKEKYKDYLEVVVAVGEPAVRKKLYEKVLEGQVTPATLIHPNVHVPSTTTVGKGTVIQFGCGISVNITIGNNVYMQPYVSLGHDDLIGDGCVLSCFSNFGGNISVGEYTYLGLSTCIKQGVTIGANTVLGMGSVVYNNIPDEVIALGNPARAMRANTERRVFK